MENDGDIRCVCMLLHHCIDGASALSASHAPTSEAWGLEWHILVAGFDLLDPGVHIFAIDKFKPRDLSPLMRALLNNRMK
jgi:hypothetical protein